MRQIKIDSNFVDRFCNEFNGRYLTLSTLCRLNARECMFHLFGHWNSLVIEDEHVVHYYRNGATGKNEKVLSKMSLTDLNKVVFVKHDDMFILFKVSKGYLAAELVSSTLRSLESIDKKRLWLHENGVQITRTIMTFDNRMRIEFKKIDAFTLEEINNND